MGWYRLGLVVMGDQLLKQVSGGDRSRCVTQHALQRANSIRADGVHDGSLHSKTLKEAPPAGAIQLLQVTRVY